MAEAKAKRESRRQLGQWMTPAPLARRVVDLAGVEWGPETRILEPGFGSGRFLVAIIEKMLEASDESRAETLERIFTEQLFGVELDENLYHQTVAELNTRYGPLPEHNLVNDDFFKVGYFSRFFDAIIGNPPYGGTFDPEIEDALDRKFGRWDGHKLKKETYSFFIAQSLELLKDNGKLAFITSDTFLTIKTMAGLRRRLMDETHSAIQTLPSFSEETTQPTLVLLSTLSGPAEYIFVNGKQLDRRDMELVQNFSWTIDDDSKQYFNGQTVGDYLVCTSGMTIGNNELFVREIQNNKIRETMDFSFVEEPITLESEISKARLGKLGDIVIRRIRQQEREGITQRVLKWEPKPIPIDIQLPDENYKYYNKASSAFIYEEPKWAVYWKDDGDAVLTFKKTGNWYLRGVGGQKFFGREGLTWQLVAPTIKVRYLPEGYILDSGAPCGFLRPKVQHDEFWFIFGWLATDLATQILKTVINHTRNIQSKDIERLPYPWWVSEENKQSAIQLVQLIIKKAMDGQTFDRSSEEIRELNGLFAWS